jgi:hypothetical protein
MMIRFLIIILIVVVGAAALTTLNPSAEQSINPIIKGLNTVHSWLKQTPSVPEAPSKGSLTATDKNATQVHKWQDSAGEWHFSNQPPPAGIKGSIETYRNDVNITQAPPVIEVVPEPAEQATDGIPTTALPLLPITDPDRVKKLIEDAKNVQKLVNDRQKNIDQQINP